MGRFDTTKATINANVKNNGNQEITGQVLNNVLTQMVNDTDSELTELSEKIGIYKGIKKTRSIIFTDAEVPSGSTIGVSFVVVGEGGSANILVKDESDTIIKRFFIDGGNKGDIYPLETYVLPNNYKSVSVGSYGDVELDIIVESFSPNWQSNQIKNLNNEVAEQESKIKELASQLVVENVGDNIVIEPTSIDEGKFLYVNDSSLGKESSSSLQNIANYNVEELNNHNLTIEAKVSGTSSVGYVFIMSDGQLQGASLYEQGGVLTTHNVFVPNGAKTLRFTYYKDSGILTTYKGSISIKDYVLSQGTNEVALSLAGANAIRVNADTLTNGILTIDGVPTYTKKDCVLSFKADVQSFGLVSFGLGYETIRGLQVFVDGTNITYKRTNLEAFKEAHNLNIKTFIRCSVYHKLKKYVFVISTISGTYYKEFEESTLDVSETYGVPFVYADSATILTNVVISRGGSDFKKPVWIFGDSYLSLNRERWIYHIINYGFQNYMLCGLAGATSEKMFKEFENCLKFGTPKYVVWCLGMNDGTNATPYKTYYEKVKAICEEKGIELILQTIPNIPNADKTAINTIINESGLRYINAADAVGSYTNANWYEGYLADGVHPTELGAKAIASQVLADFPEIMQY